MNSTFSKSVPESGNTVVISSSPVTKVDFGEKTELKHIKIAKNISKWSNCQEFISARKSMQDSLRGNNWERFYTGLECHGYVVICIVTLTMDTAFGLMHNQNISAQCYKITKKMFHLSFLP